jgi:hypothetical protein
MPAAARTAPHTGRRAHILSISLTASFRPATMRTWPDARLRYLGMSFAGAVAAGAVATGIALATGGLTAAVIALAVLLVPMSVFFTLGYRRLRRRFATPHPT